jgi:hypothetical protein
MEEGLCPMLEVQWIDYGREAKCAPDPAFPKGKDVDLSLGAAAACSVDLPYPAPRCGVWRLVCDQCGLAAGVTAAGRPDDPRSVRLACGLQPGPTGEFPRGKLNDADEGELTLAITSEAGVVRIDFGKPTAWIGLDPDAALACLVL